MAPAGYKPHDARLHWRAQSTRPEPEGKLGSLFALSNGLLGIRGHHEEMPAWGRPEFYVAGTYAGGPPALLGFHDGDHILVHPERIRPEFLRTLSDTCIPTLPNLPNPLAVRLGVGGEEFSHESSVVLSNERVVEFDKALLRRRLVFRDSAGRRTKVDSRRFVSFADRNLMCLEYRVTPLDHAAPIEIAPYIKKDVTNANGVVLWHQGRTLEEGLASAVECITNDTHLHVAIAQQAKIERSANATTLELFVAAGEIDFDEAVQRAKAESEKGFGACFEEHLAAWRRETEGAQVLFDGNPDTVQGFNFGQMHLHMAFPYGDSRVGVPGKGLTGRGYRFAVFWDMDFHMFPYFLLTRSEQARVLLEYRYNQLDAYRENASLWGARGAQVPWETQRDGREVTAPWLCLQEREIHMSADAAYMFRLYDDLTGDHAVMAEMGAEFIFETARFYASRILRVEENGRYELREIGCPDQYHTFADNNVFTNLMARWNLEYAIGLAGDARYRPAAARIALRDEEVSHWKRVVENFHVIEPDKNGVIEEFDGYFNLSEDLAGISQTYCAHSQAVKQPDVIAAFWPFEHLYSEKIRRKNWHFYAERTLHGSSLSHPGTAHAAARCHLNDEALYHLHRSTRMDLDDVNGDTGRGIHISGAAVEWYTVAFGFGGLTPTGEHLHFRPNLPRRWNALSFSVHWRFQRLKVALTREQMRFEAARSNTKEVVIKLQDEAPVALKPGATRTVPL